MSVLIKGEEKMELPPSPVFYEDHMDAIFRMFQENGTGNPPYAPVDQTTVVRQPEPIIPKLCPFRKKIHAMASNSEHSFNTYLSKAEYFEEEFLPCIREKCAVWNEKEQVCCH